MPEPGPLGAARLVEHDRHHVRAGRVRIRSAGRLGARRPSGRGEFVVALRELAAHRRRHPGDDLVSDLVAAAVDPDELVGTAALLLMAGTRPR